MTFSLEHVIKEERNKVLDLVKEEVEKEFPIAIISQGTPIEEGLISKDRILTLIESLKVN